MALDASGNPVISYFDSANGALKVAHCNDPNCTAGDDRLELVDTDGTVGMMTSLQLDASGTQS